MVSEKIKLIIETYSESMLKCNPFALAAKEGTLSEKAVVSYLHNLMWIFQQHSNHLLLAAEKARLLNLPRVASFMEEKYAEELDHYRWPQEDLEQRGQRVGLSTATVSQSAREVIAYVTEMINQDPTYFISYMVLVEYFTVLSAPEFLKNMETGCGIPPTHLTSISKHVLADEKHVLDDFKIISEVVHGEAQETGMLNSLAHSIELLDRFFSECAVA